MKRILIVNNNMHIGGVQKALVNLCEEIKDEYDVTLLLFYKGGELLEELPEQIKVITAGPALKYWGMTKCDARDFKERFLRSFWALAVRLFGRKRAFAFLKPFQKKMTGFDIAISYLHSGPMKQFYGGCNEFVLFCTEAARKLTFLHCDYGAIHADCACNRKLYRSFDGIAACSKGCRDAFLALMPELEKKTSVVHNCQNYERIRQLAQEEVKLAEDKINIVTVSRFGREKGVFRAALVIAGLCGNYPQLEYYLIGDGMQRAKIEDLIRTEEVQDQIHLLGEMENPYGYMRAADLLLIPSFSEAAPMVIGEAASLGTPILTTKTSSASEMVMEPFYGWVCENSVEGIHGKLEQLLQMPELLKGRRAALQKLRFTNEEAVKEFRRLVE